MVQATETTLVTIHIMLIAVWLHAHACAAHFSKHATRPRPETVMNITVLTFRIIKATKYGKTKRPP